MAKIINKIMKKINSNKSFYIFILTSEFSYLLIFFGILFIWGCDPKIGNIRFLSDVGGFSFLIGVPCFLIIHISYINFSFFVPQIKKFRKSTILLFLFRLFCVLTALDMFAYTS